MHADPCIRACGRYVLSIANMHARLGRVDEATSAYTTIAMMRDADEQCKAYAADRLIELQACDGM